jgi:hypothetical protein
MGMGCDGLMADGMGSFGLGLHKRGCPTPTCIDIYMPRERTSNDDDVMTIPSITSKDPTSNAECTNNVKPIH